MKCPTCGANLQLEDEKCPFCGNPNPFAVKHRQDMQHYHSEFQKTKTDVEQKTRRFTSVTVKITVMAVLAALIVVFAFTREETAYYRRINKLEKDVKANAQEYAACMEAYELAGDWTGLRVFYNEKHLGYGEEFTEYSAIERAAACYDYVLSCIMSYSEESPYSNSDKIAPNIAGYLDTFYGVVERTSYSESYYDECYTPEHRAAFARISEDMNAILITYCHLTDEEVAALPDYSAAKKTELVKEGLLRGK